MDTKSIHFSVWVSRMLWGMNYTPLFPLFLSPESHISFSTLSLQPNVRLSSTKKYNSSTPVFGTTDRKVAFSLFHGGFPDTGSCLALILVGLWSLQPGPLQSWFVTSLKVLIEKFFSLWKGFQQLFCLLMENIFSFKARIYFFFPTARQKYLSNASVFSCHWSFPHPTWSHIPSPEALFFP